MGERVKNKKSNIEAYGDGPNSQPGPTNKTRMIGCLPDTMGSEGPTTTSVVYQLLVQKGVIYKEDCFV
jgi:hypothetical protein